MARPTTARRHSLSDVGSTQPLDCSFSRLDWRASATRAALTALACVLVACAPLPRRAGIPTQWSPSPNFGERVPSFVVIHYTGADSASSAVRVLSSTQSQVSAHYLISRDGTIVQLVDERARAWHAGESRWGALGDLNSASIGVELDNDGRSAFPPIHIDALLSLLSDLRQRYRLPAPNYLGHSDIAPRRKLDPGPLFPWRTLAASGFGVWCDAPYPDPPPTFDALGGLRALGYDMRQPDAALSAFRARYAPGAPT